MQILLFGAATALALAMLLSLYRVLRGPTAFDRLTGLGLIGTKTIVLLVVLRFLTGRVDLLVDITLSYTLISVIGSLILAKYFEQKGDEAVILLANVLLILGLLFILAGVLGVLRLPDF